MSEALLAITLASWIATSSQGYTTIGLASMAISLMLSGLWIILFS